MKLALVLGCIVASSGCVTVYGPNPVEPRKVYGFQKKEADHTYYQSALIDQRLEKHKLFRIRLRNLSVEKNDGKTVYGNGATPLETQCLSSKEQFSIVGIKIRPGTEPKTISVAATLRSPFFMGMANRDLSISTWIDDCHCADIKGETAKNCFDHRLLKSVLTKIEALPVADRTAIGFSEEDAPNGVTLGDAARIQFVHAAGWPLIGFDASVQRDRMLVHPTGATTFMGQKLDPGEQLCLHTTSHVSTWIENPEVNVDSAEPTGPACFDWHAVMRGRYRMAPSSSTLTSVGVDPLARSGPRWMQGDPSGAASINAQPRQTAVGNLITTIDMVNGSNQNPYRYALLFNKNVWFSLPQGAMWDSALVNPSSEKGTFNTGDRASFLLLIRDRSLMEFIRDYIANNLKSDPDDPTSKFSDMPDGLNIYFQNIVRTWANENDRDVADTAEWLRDLVFPVNARPFVRIPVLVDGRQEYVRAGATLLNLIDKRLGLSTQVFDLRGGGKSINDENAGVDTEASLIVAAVSQLRFKRRFGLTHWSIDLKNASRLEDLMITIKSGDELSWR
ncbi:MAG: hypothetical protein G8D90_16670 [gamma proteobacterium symbiont of Clathrolucina costata]|uniref:Uncharacterized protein n=1 Tax=Candidatus Thiodiazotropha taylori TaxID=2792791 RepID=A0A9E4NH16_9GAMM|nr:hypothetical protein [Candidatus Thiodiazotropha taylori]MCW4235269.1 hypothetical protein [Candidatus Thiodiazotropha endolucinida]